MSDDAPIEAVPAKRDDAPRAAVPTKAAATADDARSRRASPPVVDAPAPATAALPVDPRLQERFPAAQDAAAWSPLVTFPRTQDQRWHYLPSLTQIGTALHVGVGPLQYAIDEAGNLLPLPTAGIELAPEALRLLDGDLLSFTAHGTIGDDGSGTFLAIGYELGARGEPPPVETFRLEGERWRRLETTSAYFTWSLRRVGPWKDGAVLALRTFQHRYAHPADDPEVPVPDREIRRSKLAIAGQKAFVVLRGRPKAPTLAVAGQAMIDFVSTADGRLLALFAGDGGATLLAYDDASGVSTTRAVPLAEGGRPFELRLHRRGPDDVFVAGTVEVGTTQQPLVVHADAHAWQTLEVPCDGALQLATAGDAPLLSCRVQLDASTAVPVLLRRGADAWQLATPPVPDEYAEIAAIGSHGGHSFALVTHERETTLWWTGPRRAPHAFADHERVLASIGAAVPEL